MTERSKENCITLIVFGVVTLGLYAMGAGGFSVLGALPLLNLDTSQEPK